MNNLSGLSEKMGNLVFYRFAALDMIQICLFSSHQIYIYTIKTVALYIQC